MTYVLDSAGRTARQMHTSFGLRPLPGLDTPLTPLRSPAPPPGPPPAPLGPRPRLPATPGSDSRPLTAEEQATARAAELRARAAELRARQLELDRLLLSLKRSAATDQARSLEKGNLAPEDTSKDSAPSATRPQRRFPSGQIGNDRPILITDERWESPELQILIESRHHDPRTGTVEFRLTNIQRAEPAAELFAVPAGYTIIGGNR